MFDNQNFSAMIQTDQKPSQVSSPSCLYNGIGSSFDNPIVICDSTEREDGISNDRSNPIVTDNEEPSIEHGNERRAVIERKAIVETSTLNSGLKEDSKEEGQQQEGGVEEQSDITTNMNQDRDFKLNHEERDQRDGVGSKITREKSDKDGKVPTTSIATASSPPSSSSIVAAITPSTRMPITTENGTHCSSSDVNGGRKAAINWESLRGSFNYKIFTYTVGGSQFRKKVPVYFTDLKGKLRRRSLISHLQNKLKEHSQQPGFKNFINQELSRATEVHHWLTMKFGADKLKAMSQKRKYSHGTQSQRPAKRKLKFMDDPRARTKAKTENRGGRKKMQCKDRGCNE